MQYTEKQNSNSPKKLGIEERRRLDRILDRRAEPNSDNKNLEMELGYSTLIETTRGSMNSLPSSQSQREMWL